MSTLADLYMARLRDLDATPEDAGAVSFGLWCFDGDEVETVRCYDWSPDLVRLVAAWTR